MVPVFVYASYDEAELFVNGKSQGRRVKAKASEPTHGGQTESLESRYRLMWDDVPFEAGELKAVAYRDGRAVDSVAVRTAGKPHHIGLEYSRIPSAASGDRTVLRADGKDLAYVTVSVLDKDGNLCPMDSTLLSFKVRGAGRFRAAANGDPTCLDSFVEPRMHAFSGKCTVIVQSLDLRSSSGRAYSGRSFFSRLFSGRHTSTNRRGTVLLRVKAKGLKTGKCSWSVK